VSNLEPNKVLCERELVPRDELWQSSDLELDFNISRYTSEEVSSVKEEQKSDY
jgi:hypothetical protein